MTNRAQYAKFISAIKEAIQSSSEEDNLSFIIGSIVLFEENYAAQNKDNFRKILNEALAVYGPATAFAGDDRVIPLYILLAKYSRSCTHSEIFERMDEAGTYRKSARFYVEWSKIFHQAGHSSRAKEIIDEGIKRGARPESLLQAAICDMHLETTMASKTPGRPPRSARKQLFTKSFSSSEEEKQSEFVMPSENDPSGAFLQPAHVSLIPLLDVCDEYIEDAENVRPNNVEEIVLRRKTLGILVPATGFVLEDYDLSKVYEEDEKKESNRTNIGNGSMSPGIRGNSSNAETSGAVRALFQSSSNSITYPVARSAFVPESVQPEPQNYTEEFASGFEALKDLRPLDDDLQADRRRMTGFEKQLLRKKSLANKTVVPPPQPKPDPLDVLFAKMKVSAPSTSKE